MSDGINIESPSLDVEDGPEEAVLLPVSLGDFVCDMKSKMYMYTPARELWPAASVDARIPPVILRDTSGNPLLDDKGQPKKIPASKWLAANRPVEQMTWAPGMLTIIRHKLISEGGWIEHPGATVFNLYREPWIELGDPTKAGPWLDHVAKVYPNEADHIIKWCAQRVQQPHDKINHALVLGGRQGIGKDTILEPVKRAIGPWNFIEVSPKQMLGRFNGFVKSVILRVSEARDLGEVDRFVFYDATKVYTAAPPDMLRVDEKNLREYSMPNCTGMIITSNYKTDGIYLPSDDRRHYVAWSDLSKEDFTADYWNGLYGFYESGGYEHVAAYLAQLDISDFNAKAPPPKTAAFWEIVEANRSSESGELDDVLDELGRPDALPLSRLKNAATGEAAEWLRDRRNRRAIPHRLEDCGYSPIRNDTAQDGLWKVNGRREVIYGRRDLTERERLAAARMVTATLDWSEDQR